MEIGHFMLCVLRYMLHMHIQRPRGLSLEVQMSQCGYNMLHLHLHLHVCYIHAKLTSRILHS